jgi:hypothetical protein
VLLTTAQYLMQGERDFVGVRRAPGENTLELNRIVGDGADFHQLGFDDLRVSHRELQDAICRRPLCWFGENLFCAPQKDHIGSVDPVP